MSNSFLNVVSEAKIAVIVESFKRKELKVAVGELEDLSSGEILVFLEQTGILDNPVRLAELVKATLTLDGQEEISNVLAALEPEKIRDVVHVSGLLVEDVGEFEPSFDVVEQRREISLAHKHAIMLSGNQLLIKRLVNLDSLCRERGPWAIIVRDKTIIAEQVASILSAIISATREREWKLATIRAVGLELFAYAALQAPQILTTLINFDWPLYSEVEQMMGVEKMEERALAHNEDALAEFIGEEEVDIPTFETDDTLESLTNELRKLGGKEMELEADVEIANLLREGLPEEE